MSRNSVLSLVNDLSRGLADQGICGHYYDDIVHEIGQRPIFTRATLVAVDGATATFALPDTAIRLLYVLYDDRILAPASLRELEAVNPHWRDERGTPIAYVTERENARSFRLYPVPDVASKSFIFLTGLPFGRDYPELAVVIVHTEDRELPDWLDLPVALDILGREFGRESDHRDPAFAEMCGQLAVLMYRMLEL